MSLYLDGRIPSFCSKWDNELRRKDLGPVHAGEICERSFISPLRPAVNTNPLQKQSFWTTLFQREEFEKAGIAFLCARKTF